MASHLRNRTVQTYALTLCALASAAVSLGQVADDPSDGSNAADPPAMTFGLGSQSGPVAGEPLRERIGDVRVPFVANSGQVDPSVAYYAPTFAGTVYLTKKGEIVYSLPATAKEAKTTSSPAVQLAGKTVGKGWSLNETPLGGKARVTAGQRAEAQVSYFIGNDPSRWRSGIATYETVGLGEVWPGVHLSLQAYGNNVEKLFTVEPGADPSRIRMRMTGARSLRVNEAGALVAATGLGEVTFTRPLAYQERDGVRRAVTVAYRAKGRQYGFAVSGHDPALPVMIDPLLQATYLGGSDPEALQALAVHPTTGEVFVAGGTSSADFPGTAGGAQPVLVGAGDAFVALFDASLTALIQATYLGGSSGDGGIALAIHPTTGDVFVTGLTGSTDFPGTAGGAQPAYGGGKADGFVALLNATLTTLTQSTYLGGSGADFPDFGPTLAIHPTTGEVFVAGFTESTNFPGTTGGAQPASGGPADTFVARLNATLTMLNQATYLGGSSHDFSRALAIHPLTGEVFVTGDTGSADFPGTAGGAQAVFGGGGDAFLARLNPALTILNQGTYLGGSNVDVGRALIIHPTSGEAFVTGDTYSTDFPGTTGGAQPGINGVVDAFVARFNATLTTLNQATYLGGSNGDFDSVRAVAIHPATDEVFVAGGTTSTDFPGTAGGAQPAHGGSGDAFVARLNASLNALNQATYLGGSGDDSGFALAIHPISGEVYAAGLTYSADFPGTTGGAQPALGGNGDTFLARLAPDLRGGRVVVNDLVTLDLLRTSFDITPVKGGPAGTYTITASFTNTSSTSIHDPVFEVTELSGGNLLLNADGGPGGVGASLTPDVGADAILSPQESFTTAFVIGLQTRKRFTFFVDLLGIPEP